MRRTSFLAVAVVVLLSAAAPSQAASSVSARWEMDEPSGTTVMRDSSGHGGVGRVGSDVRSGVVRNGVTGYRFPTVSPDAPPVRPGHTVVVPDAPVLDPRGRTFTVEIRLRPAGRDGNVLQKGQARTAGGFWKIELNAGEPTCLFRGPDGTTNAVRARGRDITGGWHTIRCVSGPKSVELWVDGVRAGRNTGRTGSIDNDHTLSVGGKQNCNQVTVGCDYFSGQLDSIRISST